MRYLFHLLQDCFKHFNSLMIGRSIEDFLSTIPSSHPARFPLLTPEYTLARQARPTVYNKLVMGDSHVDISDTQDVPILNHLVHKHDPLPWNWHTVLQRFPFCQLHIPIGTPVPFPNSIIQAAHSHFSISCYKTDKRRDISFDNFLLVSFDFPCLYFFGKYCIIISTVFYPMAPILPCFAANDLFLQVVN